MARQNIPFLSSLSARTMGVLLALALLLIAALAWWQFKPQPQQTATAPVTAASPDPNTVTLTAEQAREMQVGPAQTAAFAQQNQAMGMIDFDQDHNVQVFAQWQGRIGKVLVQVGDRVAAGQVLYTLVLPDLAQAESTLIAAAGVLKNANETLARAKPLYAAQSIALKELQQNTADQQAADAAYRAARKTLALFGLGAKEMDQVEAGRRVDTEMQVRSPFAGRVTERAAAPGSLVQPGIAPAPITVANTDKLWMVANVPESQLAAYSVGQTVEVTVEAYPHTTFIGVIRSVGEVSDPSTHRIALRAEVQDPKHLLRPQMLANFRITVGAPQTNVAVPANALVRESDGTYSAWVTTDGLVFHRRVVDIGETQNGLVQVRKGLKPDERIARDKALFLSNVSSADSGD